MQFVSLASGSKGNCYYLASDEGAFLIDCGISLKRLVAGVEAQTPGGMENLGGIFITHEHRDHVCRTRAHCSDATTFPATAQPPRWRRSARASSARWIRASCGRSKERPWSWPILPSAGRASATTPPIRWSYQILWREKKIGMLTDAGSAVGRQPRSAR